MFCKFCGSELVDDAVFCSNCGEKISKDVPPKFCACCGTELDDDSMFCSNCGKKIKSEKGNVKAASSRQHKERQTVKKETEAPNKETVSSRRKSQKKDESDCWTDLYINNKHFVYLHDDSERLYCPNCHNFASSDNTICSFCNHKFVNDEKNNIGINSVDNLANKKDEVASNIKSSAGEMPLKSNSEENRADNSSFGKNTTSTATGWAVFFAITAIIGFGIAYYNYDVINQCNAVIEKNEGLLQQKDRLEKEYADLLECNSGVFVKFDKFTNSNDSTYLDHKYITYLRIYYSVVNEVHSSASNKSYIKVKNPYGELMQGASCPNGYSLLVDSYSGSHNVGFGNSCPGAYVRGTYTIEFWNDNMCLCRKKLWIE